MESSISNTAIVNNDSDSSECDEPMQLSDAQKATFRIHGCPKSGRTWKDKAEKRTSSIKKDVAFNSSWTKKMQERQQMKNIKALQAELRDNKKNLIEDKKRRRKEQEERRAENQKKSEIVQVIKNVHKLKRAKKKFLRKIEKRDMTVVDKS